MEGVSYWKFKPDLLFSVDDWLNGGCWSRPTWVYVLADVRLGKYPRTIKRSNLYCTLLSRIISLAIAYRQGKSRITSSKLSNEMEVKYSPRTVGVRTLQSRESSPFAGILPFCTFTTPIWWLGIWTLWVLHGWSKHLSDLRYPQQEKWSPVRTGIWLGFKTDPQAELPLMHWENSSLQQYIILHGESWESEIRVCLTRRFEWFSSQSNDTKGWQVHSPCPPFVSTSTCPPQSMVR